MLLSIIIPVYNAAQTLPRCLDSIVRQQFADFELHLVDDGSTDRSAAICRDYAARDARIHVWQKKNGGVSAARNFALDKAQGEWVMFVDADDELTPSFSDLPLASFREDMVAFPPVIVSADGKQERFSCPLLENEDNCRDFAPLICTTVIKAPWSKVYRRSTIGTLRFDTTIRFGEDMVFNMQFLKRARSFRYDDTKAFYLYCIPQVDFYEKYAMPTDEAVSTMARMYEAFWALGVKNEEFERTYFLMMKRLCQAAVYKAPQTWFRAPEVRHIYKRVKHLMPLTYRMNYWLMSHRCINALRRLF